MTHRSLSSRIVLEQRLRLLWKSAPCYHNEDTRDNRSAMTKMRKFVRSYLKDFNATNAAKSVGCSERSAYELGCRWLRKVKASGLYAEEADKVLEQAGVNVHNVVLELVKLATSNISDYIK